MHRVAPLKAATTSDRLRRLDCHHAPEAAPQAQLLQALQVLRLLAAHLDAAPLEVVVATLREEEEEAGQEVVVDLQIVKKVCPHYTY